MKSIKMKIKGYDKESHSLLVSFASDQTYSQNPEDYQAFAFQTSEMWPEVTDIEQIKLELAKAGMSIVRQQIAKENIGGNPVRLIELQRLVGMSFEYNVSDIAIEGDNTTVEV
jgi:hypothetical protein